MSDHAIQLYFADGATDTTEEGEGDKKVNLVWKVILRTGTWKLRPGPGGVKLKAPLKVFRDKATPGNISMAELVKSFDDNAVEYVSVPLRHSDGTEENTGYVRQLKIEDVKDDKGKVVSSNLWAGIEFTEPDIAGKVERKTIPSVSAGVLFGYERTEDAKKFSQALIHVCLTSKPWINGTGNFTNRPPESVMASEPDDLPIGEVELADGSTDDPADAADPAKKNQPASGTVVWKPEEGYQFARGRVQKALDDWRRQVLSSIQTGNGVYPDLPYYSVDDINAAEGRALIACGYGSDREAWVATFKFTDDGAEIEPFMNWTPAKQEWVAASQQQEPNPTPSPSPARPAGRPVPASSSSRSLIGLGLREAQAARAERFGLGSRPTTTTGGTRMGRLADLLAGVELSDEQREAIAREEAEQERRDALLADTAAERRNNERDTLLSQLDNAGIGTPGLKRYVHDVYRDDDGGPAIELSLTLDENGSKSEKTATSASAIIKGFVERLPKDKEGRVALSQQAKHTPGDEPPADVPVDKDAPNAEGGKKDKRTPSQKIIDNAAEMLSQGIDIGVMGLSEADLKAVQEKAATLQEVS